jgi:hypothetical protein
MNAVIQTPPTPLVGVGRNVIFRTRGYAHGPVVRMVSPSAWSAPPTSAR